MKRGPAPKLTPEQVAWAFEQLTCNNASIKALAIDLNVHRTTLEKTLIQAEIHGLTLWRRNKWKMFQE